MDQSPKKPIIDAEQDALLQAALRIVKIEAFEMKCSLDRNEITNGLNHASSMLSELRTSLLSPKYYYRLYIDVTNELQHFLSYFTDNYLEKRSPEHANRLADLYEFVQFTGNIIPRLYLLITVGIVYIKSGESSACVVLADLVEMCRGVQHPLRGLFLRNYLLTVAKEFIPDRPLNFAENDDNKIYESGTSNTDENGNVLDGIEFIMNNFAEMNKLWVRMQHLGPSKERTKRERERRELRILVGTNLVRLSQLEHLNLEHYNKVVLPRILEQLVSCREPISQEYLMECVIQVFPDHFHLNTLNEFLEACVMLHPSVQIKAILTTLIGHLTAYLALNDLQGIPEGLELFELFCSYIEKVVASREMPLEDIIAIQISLMNMALTCYKNNTSYPNTIFNFISALFKKLKIETIVCDTVIGRELTKLLRLPLDHFTDVDHFLQLSAFADTLTALDFRGRTFICAAVLETMVQHNAILETKEQVDKIFQLIDSLLVDQSDQPKELSDDFKEGQELVARLVHLIHNSDVEKHYELLQKARKVFGHGGLFRLKHTIPPTIFSMFKLMDRYWRVREEIEIFDLKMEKMFQFCVSTINALRVEAEMPEMALRFYLQAAILANNIRFEKSGEIAYELVASAISVYEEEVSDSREQIQTLTLLIGTVQQLNCLTDESHEPLRNKCALFATKIIKRLNQVHLLCLAARLFWFSKVVSEIEFVHDGQRVAECLKKALKIASQCMEELIKTKLYVHVLSEYFFFYEAGCDEIKPQVVNELIDKIRDSLMQFEPSTETQEICLIFENLLKQIRNYQQLPPEDCTLSFSKFVL